MTQHATMFYRLIILFICCALVYSAKNYCPTINGCRCSFVRTLFSGVHFKATCKGDNPQISALPLNNLTYLTLQECKFVNSTMLWSLRNGNLTYMVKFKNTQVEYFNWDWIPDTCSGVFIGYFPTPPRLASHNQSESFKNKSCDIRSGLNITTLYIYYTDYNMMPDCVPNTIRTISLHHVPLLGFNASATNQTDQKWPTNLKTLKINSAKFESIGPQAFRSAPTSLSVLSIVFCKFAQGKFPTQIPRTIHGLTLNYDEITQLTDSSLAPLAGLDNLAMRGNFLTHLPREFPADLRSLDFYKNRIRSLANVDWGRLRKLIRLNLSQNKIRFIPVNLPGTLQVLMLTKNDISYCESDTFLLMKNLTHLDLSHNRLFNMPENLPRTMQTLKLRNNSIALVRSPSSYNYCVNCIFVDIAYNPWVCDSEMINMLMWFQSRKTKIFYAFGPCTNAGYDLSYKELNDFLSYMKYMSKEFPRCNYDVKLLVCNGKNLKSFPKNPPEGLTKVEITNNLGLTMMPRNIYQDQNFINKMNLDWNSLQQFPYGLPASLITLSLSNNQISDVTEEQLKPLINLKTLDLTKNRIRTIYDYQLAPLVSIKYLLLDGNPWHCDCSIQSLTIWFNKRKRPPGTALHPIFSTPFCQTPPQRKKQMISQLIGAFEYEYKCAPARCGWRLGEAVLNCSAQFQKSKNVHESEKFIKGVMPVIPENSYWIILDLSGLELLSSALKTKQLVRLKTLDLSENLFALVPAREMPRSLQNLILTRNKIVFLPDHEIIKRFLPNLKLLDLRFNEIKTIDKNQVKLLPLVDRVLLGENPLTCDCASRPLITWIQTNKGNRVTNSTENLVCTWPKRLNGISLSELNEDEYCPNFNLKALAVGLTIGVLILFIIVFVINYILHKRRLKQERKDIVQGFKDLLEREAMIDDADPETGIEEEGRYKYDAFVSYFCDGYDEDFVYKLVDELENKRNKIICLHERDFPPGRGIADNIVESIVASRKIILIISRKYASSSWCQYEVQVALTQLHKRRRGRLLVPILLEDVIEDETYAGSVKTILSAITGLPAPHEDASAKEWKHFWENLSESLT